MARPIPDPTFRPSLATEAPPETLAYVALRVEGGAGAARDAIGVVDTDPTSPFHGRMVGRVDFPDRGNELHHLGWGACREPLCGQSPGIHAERRYLIAPGAGSSRIHVVDTHPDPRAPRLVKVIEADEVRRRTGYAAPHAVRCGPDGVYLSALGGADGAGPGGLFTLDRETFEPRGRWGAEDAHGEAAHHVAWHPGQDTLVTSDGGTPDVVTRGLDLARVMAGGYGHALHVWDVRRRRHLQDIDLGAEQQIVLEPRPAHNPTRAYGFAGVVLSRADLSSSVFLWYLDKGARGGAGEWRARRIVTVHAEAANPSTLPPMLAPLGCVPPLVTDVNLSLDDRFLYVSCWGTGELRQYDVSDPFNPALTGSVRLGGIAGRTPHPGTPHVPRGGGPHAVEVSRDGRRVYVTNSRWAAWDAQCYPAGMDGWMARLDAGRNGGLALDPRFLCEFERGMRPRRLRLDGGDASSGAACHA